MACFPLLSITVLGYGLFRKVDQTMIKTKAYLQSSCVSKFVLISFFSRTSFDFKGEVYFKLTNNRSNSALLKLTDGSENKAWLPLYMIQLLSIVCLCITDLKLQMKTNIKIGLTVTSPVCKQMFNTKINIYGFCQWK